MYPSQVNILWTRNIYLLTRLHFHIINGGPMDGIWYIMSLAGQVWSATAYMNYLCWCLWAIYLMQVQGEKINDLYDGCYVVFISTFYQRYLRVDWSYFDLPLIPPTSNCILSHWLLYTPVCKELHFHVSS